MPGLSQLKEFNKDIQSLGDEITLRASRGEKPIVLPIPKGITVENDSEDFVLGMPDNPKIVDNSNVDEDLSEITGLSTGKASGSDSGAEAAPSFEAPDMSSLLAPIDLGGEQSDSGLPDLSEFMDAPVEEEQPEEIEEEPEEISVADMGLEALLAGEGFDGTEGTEEEEEESLAEEEAPVDQLPVDSGESLEEPAPENLSSLGLDDFDASVLDIGEPKEEAPAAEPQPAYKYRNGEYEAEAEGYAGKVHVKLSIENDVITSISAWADEDDPEYFGDAMNTVIPQIGAKVSADGIDACSGATYSSNGIIEAARKALEQAAN